MTLLVSAAVATALALTQQAPPPPTPPTTTGALKVAVYDFDVSGFDPHQARVVVASVLAELRKLEGTNVIGMSEVKQMLDHEAQKQLLGCSQESCLGEIADALGVDVLVVGAIARIGDETTFGMKRLDQKKAKVIGHVERRFNGGNGEEVLVAVGPAVAELFPDVPLRAGQVRGVAKEMALRLNPPPLPPLVFWGGVGVTGVTLAGAGVLLGLNLAAQSDAQTYKETAKPLDNAVFQAKADVADSYAYGAYGAGGAAVAFAIATGVAAFFTDFWGYADANNEAAASPP